MGGVDEEGVVRQGDHHLKHLLRLRLYLTTPSRHERENLPQPFKKRRRQVFGKRKTISGTLFIFFLFLGIFSC